jgi:hypothetical protein
MPVPAPDLKTMLIGRVRRLGYDTALLHLTQHPPG